MRKAEIKIYDTTAGWLVEDENGYHYNYDSSYLNSSNPDLISLTLPLKEQPYTSKILFPFFDGLIPEGWLLDIAQNNWKLNPRDRMGLLMACCKDCIGAVSVHPLNNEQL
jgi:serine/threonine-protein kinase HipA